MVFFSFAHWKRGKERGRGKGKEEERGRMDAPIE